MSCVFAGGGSVHRATRAARMKLLTVAGPPLAIGLFWLYRRSHLRWGATEQELSRTMPADEIVRAPTFNATRAVTVNAQPSDIWPWIVQMGFGRAGWYSYDLLDNLGRSSAEMVMPELQELRIGDMVP